MTQVTITKIFDKTKTSARTGKPFVSRGILTNEYGERWISGFKGKENEHWQVGDTVDINIEEKGDYLNFSVPKGTHQVAGKGFEPSPDINRLERKLDAIFTEIQTIKPVLGDILRKLEQEDALAGEFNTD